MVTLSPVKLTMKINQYSILVLCCLPRVRRTEVVRYGQIARAPVLPVGWLIIMEEQTGLVWSAAWAEKALE